MEAVSVFLDSAYCLDVGDALKENITLACELLTLAPRFGVSSLLHTIASVITSRLSVDSSCIQVYQQLKQIGSNAQYVVLRFIGLNLEKFSNTYCFKDISIFDLVAFVSCKYVIATEIELFRTIKRWISHHENAVCVICLVLTCDEQGALG